MSGTEPVGTWAEEAARLFAALQGSTSKGNDSDASSVSDESEEHTAAGHPECRWCPVCQLARMAKATSPDVREHLSQAAMSLALAVKGLLEDPDPTTRRAVPLEKIDLTEE